MLLVVQEIVLKEVWMGWHVRLAIKFTVTTSQMNPECSNCRKLEGTIDLRDISQMSYAPGDMIIGCLDTLGWVVIRGILIEKETYEIINVISEAGYNGRVTKKP